MFERLFSFLKQIPGSTGEDRRPGSDDPQVAAAALLFHVMHADGDQSERERDRIEQVLAETYGLGDEELSTVFAAAEEAEREAVDLYTFTSVLKRHLDEDARAEFIGVMWDIVYADGELHEVEDNVIWRVAELIGVGARDRVRLRQRAAGSAGFGT
jgi:uncharacterized tellurite resistance protein B-like protein